MSSITSIIRSRRLMSAVGATVTALALVPAGASAATTWFGSSLNHSPANAGNSCADNGVMGSSLCTHVGSYYPGHSGRATSPVTGTITKIRLLAEGPTTMVFKVVDVRHMSSDHKRAQAKAVAKSHTVHVLGTTDSNGDPVIESFSVNMKVKRGEELAVDTRSNTAEYCSDGTPGQLLFDPTLAIGHGFRSSAGVDSCLMTIQAVVKH